MHFESSVHLFSTVKKKGEVPWPPLREQMMDGTSNSTCQKESAGSPHVASRKTSSGTAQKTKKITSTFDPGLRDYFLELYKLVVVWLQGVLQLCGPR